MATYILSIYTSYIYVYFVDKSISYSCFQVDMLQETNYNLIKASL